MPLTKHGKCHTRLYQIWNAMKQRCSNPKAISYKYYGAKGVTVCQEWQDGFQAFHDWATANGYSDNLTLDRVDANGDYCPDNCRWTTNKEQQNNTSYNRLITYGAETHNITQWAEILNIPRNVLYNRIRRGWDIEKIITTKKRDWRFKNGCEF